MILAKPRPTRLLRLLAASAICLLAWGIFVYHLTDNSMWWDEHQTWNASREGPISTIHNIVVDVHPPASYLWVWAWMTWMGGSDDLFVMRLSSVVVSTLTVAFVYRIGKSWFGSSFAGAGAAVFLLTSGVFVFYSRILRMYAPVVLLAVLSWVLLQRILENKSSRAWGYAAVLALMAYTHYTSVFIVGSQFVFTMLFYRRQFRRVLIAYGIAFLAIIPWLPGFVLQLEQNRAQQFADNALLAGPVPGLLTTPDRIIGFWSTYTNQQTAFVLLLVMLALTIGLQDIQSRQFRRWLVAASMWFFLTMAIIFAFGLFIPVYRERFVITVLPGLALLVGAAVRCLSGFWPRLVTVAIIALAGIWYHAWVFDDLTVIPPYRQLLETVAERYYPGDKIWYNLNFGARGSSLQLSAAYHLERDTPQLNSDDFVWNAPRDFENLAEAPRVWDVRPDWIPMRADARPVLESGRFITEEYQIREYTVRLYEAPPVSQPPSRFGDLFEMVISPMPDTRFTAGEVVSVTSWWRALQQVRIDYSYGIYLRNVEQQFVAQTDASLQIGNLPTSQWESQGDFAPLLLSLDIPQHLPAGEYELLAGVYYWEDGRRLAVSRDNDQQIDSELNLLRVATIVLE